jgi:Putative beta-barrel porin-2, OmpL-like. bbp2
MITKIKLTAKLKKSHYIISRAFILFIASQLVGANFLLGQSVEINNDSRQNNQHVEPVVLSTTGTDQGIGQSFSENSKNFFKKYAAFKSKLSDTTEAPSAEPFAFADFSWLNGNNRQSSKVFDGKYFTGDFTCDVNYTRSNTNPIDNTVLGSTALSRNNEFTVSFVGIGGDFHYQNVRGRLMTQFGTRATVVPRNDYSGYRGQYDLPDAYRYLSEAYGGYHFNKWHGINVDMGIFMSYIGMFSYNNFENWSYQPSYTSDNTPWFFNGIRIQMFPTVKTKIEVWLINGWQSYGTFNKMPGVGFSFLHRGNANNSFISNNYFGTDVAGIPAAKRYHTDNSWQHQYFNNPKANGIKRAAFTITGDFGVQSGGGYTPFGTGTASNFISGMVYNRLWFGKDAKWGWTIGGGFLHNPSRYLALIPPGQATDKFISDAVPGAKMDGWDASTCIDYNPNEFLTIRLELVHRYMNIPYFNGPGGVTGPIGYQANPSNSFNPNSYTPSTSSWNPDLVNSETRGILALIVRF